MSRALRVDSAANIEWSEIADSETLNVGNIAPLTGILTIGGSAGNPDVYVANGHDFQVWGIGAELRTDGGASLIVGGSGSLQVPALGAHRIYGGTLSVEIPSSFIDQAVFESPAGINPKAVVRADGGEPANTLLFQVQDNVGGNLLSVDKEGDLAIAGSLYLPTTTSTVGTILIGGTRFLHNYGLNTFIGRNSGNYTTTGADLVGIGKNTFTSATGPASRCVAVGDEALAAMTAASFNTAVGYYALTSLTTGESNVGLGDGAGTGLTTVNYVTAVGSQAVGGNNTAPGITGVGRRALFSNTSGTENTAVGYNAAQLTTTGYRTVAVGYEALQAQTIGHDNIAVGYQSLYSAINNRDSIAIGSSALHSATTGGDNIAIGTGALYSCVSGGPNVAVGSGAGYNATGSNNVFIGWNAGYNETGNAKLYIANSSTSNPLIGGDFAAGTVTFNGAYTFPAADGTVGQQLQTNGAGVLSWANPGGGGVYIYPPGTTNPTSPSPNDGDIYFNTVFESWQYYDASRSKWLSITEFPFSWGHDTTDGNYLRSCGMLIPGTSAGILIPRDATIKRITIRSSGGDATKQFNLLVNGVSVTSFSLAASLYKNNAANVDVDEDDYVWVESSSAGTPATDVAAIFWVSWRTP